MGLQSGGGYNAFVSIFSYIDFVKKHLYEIKPEPIVLDDFIYLLYPFDIRRGLKFYYSILSNEMFHDFHNFFRIGYSRFSVMDVMKLINIDFLIDVLSDVIVLYDNTSDIREILYKSSFKQIVYLLYIIKKMNFPNSRFDVIFNTYNEKYIINELKRLVDYHTEFQKNAKRRKENFETVRLGGTDYVEEHMDGKFYSFEDAQVIDYVLSFDRFYLVIFDSLINKIMPFLFNISYEVCVPKIICNKCLSNCSPSCPRFFNSCSYRTIDWNMFIPFSAIYVFLQYLEVMRIYNKEDDIDTMVRSLGYSLSSITGKQNSDILKVGQSAHLQRTEQLVLKRSVDYVFGNDKIVFDTTKYKMLLGQMEESDESSFISLKTMLHKIYGLLNNNVGVWCNDHNKDVVIDVVDKFKDFIVRNDGDFTDTVIRKSQYIRKLDHMLRYFPHDMDGVEGIAERILTELNRVEKELHKSGGKRIPSGNPKKALLESSSILHKRIAIDDALFVFYRENRKTKKINDILFWKWSIALFYVSEIILELPEDHKIYGINFNDI